VFLDIAGTYGDHANQNVEFGGAALPYLSIDARRTLTTMGAELSAEFATFQPDEVLIDYVKARSPAGFEPQYPDADAGYGGRRATPAPSCPRRRAAPAMAGIWASSAPARPASPPRPAISKATWAMRRRASTWPHPRRSPPRRSPGGLRTPAVFRSRR